MSNDSWKEHALLVMSSLEDHEERIAKLEAALVEIKIDMARLLMKYSFLGSLSATFLVAVPAVVYYFFQK